MIDETDRRLLRLLQEDGQTTNAELARQVGLAPATTLERVRKLKQRGVLRRVVGLVDAEAVGLGTTAFVSVSLASHEADQVGAFRDRVSALPEVLECYHLTGASDYLLKVVFSSIHAYEDFLLHRLAVIPNVSKIHTSFVLSTVKHETRLPLPDGPPSS